MAEHTLEGTLGAYAFTTFVTGRPETRLQKNGRLSLARSAYQADQINPSFRSLWTPAASSSGFLVLYAFSGSELFD